jgi:NADH pyrophosphatase NudC (nudix superfamily)
MKYLGGDVADHDHEVEEARWVSVDKALAMLEYQQERDVVAEGFAKLEKLLK